MKSPDVIVGLGGLLSDAGCCVLKNGKLVAAVEQSKVSRGERHQWFPEEAFRSALEAAGIDSQEVNCLAIARPLAADAESDTLLSVRNRFPEAEVIVVDHHAAHAASAYFVSPYNAATVLSVDRAGDYRSAVLFRADGNRLTPARELYFPDSLGDLFNRVTELLGYEPRSDEHKVQWLSTTAAPVYEEAFLNLLHARGLDWPRFDRSSFEGEVTTRGGFRGRFLKAIGADGDGKLSPASQAAVAASLQSAVNKTVVQMIGTSGPVCIAGGLALNALLIAHLENTYKDVFVQPAAGNAGTSLGAALYVRHVHFGESGRVPFHTLSLGPQFSADEIKRVLENCKLGFRFLLTEGELIASAIQHLTDGKIVAWMHGRMEFGPRALGNRSILASPLNPYSSENLNVYIKHRESFRKFAASVPAEVAGEYFETGPNSAFLATVGMVRPKHQETFRAAILSGNLIRVHTVHKEENPLYHSLLIETGKKTGLPVMYNTSFNLFGDPLVCTPRDAVKSFYSSGIDVLFAGNFVLEK